MQINKSRSGVAYTMRLAFSMPSIRYLIFILSLLFIAGLQLTQANQVDKTMIDEQISLHKDKSGVFVLDKGEQALLARAWLADHAKTSIEVQYFIWSTDNIGVLASEALLRAAERGVKVRVIVDDLMIDAPDKTLLALALHENIDIQIYNPNLTVGTSLFRRLINVVTDFRGINQRMHDKTFIVDGKIAITGGRNMADEYFDYDHSYNFRDRDVLLLGTVVNDMLDSFNRFWNSELSVDVEKRFSSSSLMQGKNKLDDEEINKIVTELHVYAKSTENFAPEIRQAITDIEKTFEYLIEHMHWVDVVFISDLPGKNSARFSLGGGGLSTTALAEQIQQATSTIIIQSPYLVLSDEAKDLFKNAIDRGVSISINTNSLASTDNIQAYSGYKNQQQELLASGLKIFEYQPFPQNQRELLLRYKTLKDKNPVFALHAKTMVIDSKVVYIGTFNLDPRSQNLNTEVGIIVEDLKLAKEVEQQIVMDMQAGNSWPATDSPDQHATFYKRLKVFFWQLMPVKSIL